MRILIVDDHAVVRRGLKEILEEEFPGAVFGEADSAGSALEQIHRQRWDVAVLDITMPGRSGLDVLKDLEAARPKLPVVVLSMHPEDQYAVRVLKAGAAGYLNKDMAPEELVVAIRKVLAGGRYVSSSLAEKLALGVRAGFDRAPHEALSNREFEVMCMLASGQAVSEIAAELSLSVKTISTYRARIMAKMGTRANADLTRYAIRQKLID